MKTSCNTL